MRKITIEGSSFEVPQNWDEITVKQFDAVQVVLRDKDEDEMSIRVLAQVACAISGLPISTLLEAPKQIYDLLMDSLSFLFNESYHKTPAHTIEINGINHSFPHEEKDITLGQWVDVDEVAKGNEVVASIMAVMLIPEGGKHDANLFEERKAMMQALPCSKILPLLSFFLHSGKEFTNLFESFLMAKVAGLQHLQSMETLVKNGGGMAQLSRWQGAIYLKWIKLLKNQLLKC